MNTEIERKFIVNELPGDLIIERSAEIKQGYICWNDLREVRCRQIDEEYFLTIKSKGNLVREEFEIKISEEQFSKIWNTTMGFQIFKQRMYVRLNEYKIEIDIFRKNLEGLILAEVEFTSISESEKFIHPEWFFREVTNEEKYKNKSLAINGLPK